jgi:hypothetical protein
MRDLVKHSEEHATEMDFDTIFSQVALAARLKYPLTVNIARNGALAKSKLRRKRKVATLRISESQPMEIAQLKAPILSSDKSSSGVNVEERFEFFQEETSEQTMGLGIPVSLKKQKRTPEAQQEEIPKSPRFDSVQPSLAEQFSIETEQEEAPQSPGLDIVQSSLVELSPVVVSVPLTSSEDHTQPAEGA